MRQFKTNDPGRNRSSCYWGWSCGYGRCGLARAGRRGRFAKPVGFDPQGGENRQGDRGENAGQGFREGAGSAGAGALGHGCGMVGMEGATL